MAQNYKDKTLRDQNRRLLQLNQAEIQKVLPEYMQAEYPKLIKLFEKYYEWMDSDGNPNNRINQLYATRDATQVPANLLDNLEDELLLGNAYFAGFKNKREAVKFSNLLYRSKGTKYSLQQFFRGFFGIDPTIEYPKEQIFRVGPKIDYDADSVNDNGNQIAEAASNIGPESRKFITDDKLYQQLSVLIKSDVSISDWLNVYKLFVHPAGVYIGSELQLVSQNEVGFAIEMPAVGTPRESLIVVEEQAAVGIEAFAQATLLVDSDGYNREILEQQIGQYQNMSLEEFQEGRDDLFTALTPNSVAFDDSDGGSSIRDFVTMADSALPDTVGVADSRDIRIDTFDKHNYDTDYDSAP